MNGNEKLVRMLIVPRRNYPMAVVRQAYQKRGKAYTTYGTTMRCVRPDQTRYQTSLLDFSSMSSPPSPVSP